MEVKPFIISRTFNTDKETMWRLWTEAEHMKQWWGPRGAHSRYCKTDLRVGGTTLYNLINPDELEIWGKQVYREIAKFDHLVYVNSFSDARGGLSRHPLLPTWPLEMLTTVTFKENNGKTNITVEWLPINANEKEIRTFDLSHDDMNQGWSGSFDQLEEYLREVEITSMYSSSIY